MCLHVEYSRERSQDGSVSIDSDGGQREHAHAHADHFHKGAEAAHERGEDPALKQRRLEL